MFEDYQNVTKISSLVGLNIVKSISEHTYIHSICKHFVPPVELLTISSAMSNVFFSR